MLRFFSLDDIFERDQNLICQIDHMPVPNPMKISCQ